jgi:endonuclease YncB( thermonuclease family)
LKNPKIIAALGSVLLFFSVSPVFAVVRQSVVVKEVLTGDTVRVVGGKTVKYAAIEAPPLQSVIPLVRTYGEKSLNFNKSLVEGKTLSLEWGPQIRDKNGNLLAYAYLEDGTFVNDAILKAGHAKHKVAPPNTDHSGILRRSELDARRDRRGLWKDEPENPFIKSEFIGEKNTKLYYFPTSPELERIPEANLVRFGSRVEAKAAGYRACPTCKESAETLY